MLYDAKKIITTGRVFIQSIKNVFVINLYFTDIKLVDLVIFFSEK